MKHKNIHFVKKIRPVRLPTGMSSSLAGTQAIDSTWKSLDKSIPSTLHTKLHHNVNPKLLDYNWAWVHRVNQWHSDGFATMGEHLRDHRY